MISIPSPAIATTTRPAKCLAYAECLTCWLLCIDKPLRHQHRGYWVGY